MICVTLECIEERQLILFFFLFFSVLHSSVSRLIEISLPSMITSVCVTISVHEIGDSILSVSHSIFAWKYTALSSTVACVQGPSRVS